jgi:hypothetical protein
MWLRRTTGSSFLFGRESPAQSQKTLVFVFSRSQAPSNLHADLIAVHHTAGAGWTFDFEGVAIIEVKLQPQLGETCILHSFVTLIS